MNTDLKIVSEISTGIIQTPSESTNHVRFYFKNTHSSIQLLIQALKPVVMFASLLFLCTGGSLDQRSGRRRRKRAGGCTPRPHQEHTLHVCTLQTKGEPPCPGPASHTRGRGVGGEGGGKAGLFTPLVWEIATHHVIWLPREITCLFCFFFQQPPFSSPLVITGHKLTSQNCNHSPWTG